MHADALFGNPNIIAIVVDENINLMDGVIDRNVELENVVATDTKVARWSGPAQSACACGLIRRSG